MWFGHAEVTHPKKWFMDVLVRVKSLKNVF